MTIAERVEQYEGDLAKLREQQAQLEVHVRRVEGAILALRAVLDEEQADATPTTGGPAPMEA